MFVEDCKDVQKRLVLYHKLFRHLYNEGRSGIRVDLPNCCKTKIQIQYKRDVDPEEGSFET